MLARLDNMVFHQLPATLDHPVSSDRGWFEHNPFQMTATHGEIVVVTGNRTCLNNNVLEAFDAAVHADQQHSVRASRRLRPGMDRSAGPLKLGEGGGLRVFNLSLAATESPESFEINRRASHLPWEGHHHFRRKGATSPKTASGSTRWERSAAISSAHNRLFDHVIIMRCDDCVGCAIYVLFIPREYRPYGFGS